MLPLLCLNVTVQDVCTEKGWLLHGLARHVRFATEVRNPQKLPETRSSAAWQHWWQFRQVSPSTGEVPLLGSHTKGLSHRTVPGNIHHRTFAVKKVADDF